MVDVSGEVVINRAVEDVFDFVADERNRYDPRVRSAELLSPGPIGVGTRFRTRSVTMGRPVEMLVEITEYERPRRLGSTTHTAGMDILSALRFEPVGAATHLRWSSQLRPRRGSRLLGPTLGFVGRRQSSRIWSGLKQTLEAREDRAMGKERISTGTGDAPVRLSLPETSTATAGRRGGLSRRPLRRVDKVLLGLEGVLGASALAGGINYVLNPQQGERGVPEVLRGTPFRSFRLPGVALIVCNAVPPVIAIVGTLRRRRWAKPAHVAVGAILMGWIVVQVAFIGFGSWLPLQAFCFALGVAIAALGVRNQRDALAAGER